MAAGLLCAPLSFTTGCRDGDDKGLGTTVDDDDDDEMTTAVDTTEGPGDDMNGDGAWDSLKCVDVMGNGPRRPVQRGGRSVGHRRLRRGGDVLEPRR